MMRRRKNSEEERRFRRRRLSSLLRSGRVGSLSGSSPENFSFILISCIESLYWTPLGFLAFSSLEGWPHLPALLIIITAFAGVTEEHLLLLDLSAHRHHDPRAARTLTVFHELRCIDTRQVATWVKRDEEEEVGVEAGEKKERERGDAKKRKRGLLVCVPHVLYSPVLYSPFFWSRLCSVLLLFSFSFFHLDEIHSSQAAKSYSCWWSSADVELRCSCWLLREHNHISRAEEITVNLSTSDPRSPALHASGGWMRVSVASQPHTNSLLLDVLWCAGGSTCWPPLSSSLFFLASALPTNHFFRRRLWCWTHNRAQPVHRQSVQGFTMKNLHSSS